MQSKKKHEKFPAVLSFAIFFIACGDNSSSVSAGNSHNENSSLFSSSDTPMSNDGETSEFSSSAKSSSNSAKSSSSEDEQGDGDSEAAVTSSSSVVSSSSDGKTPASSSEGTPTSSSTEVTSSAGPTSSADAIAQNVQWSSNTPTTFAAFSATGVLVKTFVAIPQSAEDSFKALQVPHGTYYLKDLKSNYIKKVVK